MHGVCLGKVLGVHVFSLRAGQNALSKVGEIRWKTGTYIEFRKVSVKDAGAEIKCECFRKETKNGC